MTRIAIFVLFLACGSPHKQQVVDDRSSIDAAHLPEGKADGFITYYYDGNVFRIEAKQAAQPFNISDALDELSEGSDSSPAVSKNGEFMTLDTSRFAPECRDWSCLAVVPKDLKSGAIVYVNGTPIRSNGRSAISNDGKLIVFSTSDDAHQQDLYVIQKNGNTWGAPLLITSESPHEFNSQPVLSKDASKVLFSCGPVAYGQDGSGICEVSSDANDFKRIVSPEMNDGTANSIAYHADYLGDNSIVFEADWQSEQIYIRTAEETPNRVLPAQSNDNSPCGLPGGYIASLWLGREEGNGEHELKIMAPDGSEFVILTPGIDVIDTGISCHK